MNGRIFAFAALCAFAALWICAVAQATSVRAWLDRDPVRLGETVTLNVQVDGEAQAAQPDFGMLSGDFDLTGTQSSSSVSFVNGKATSSTLWAVGLTPKQVGTFAIPALSVAGQQTQPLTLRVLPAAADATKPGGDVFVEATAEPPSPYVQQQVLLTVKLYFAVNLIDGNLDDPQIKGAVVRKLGQDSHYRAQAGNRGYNVVERHYALTPEGNGALTVPPIVFRGHAADPNGGGFFFNQGRAIGAQSPPISLSVRSRPAGSGTGTWLPARSMSLTATGIDATTPAQAGEPLTLNLRLEAQGLGFEQLPRLELPRIDGADVYPDKAVTQDKDDGQWLYGVRERKFAIVPNRAGPLTLPSISVQWWDTAHDRAQIASLPAITINVQPAAATAASGAAPTARDIPVAPRSDGGPVPPTATSMRVDTSQLPVWRTVAFVALALWALTLIGWIRWLVAQRRHKPASAPVQPQPDAAPARRAFAEACAREDWPMVARALLAWARQQRAELRNLGELRKAVCDSAQARAIVELERACYGKGDAPRISAADLARQFAHGPVLGPVRKVAAAHSALPPLYPAPLR
ncbi:MAG: protein BatD [Proteobacteria bacterium]|nr:protein BatD [Pseudomonadota bacterium]